MGAPYDSKVSLKHLPYVLSTGGERSPLPFTKKTCDKRGKKTLKEYQTASVPRYPSTVRQAALGPGGIRISRGQFCRSCLQVTTTLGPFRVLATSTWYYNDTAMNSTQGPWPSCFPQCKRWEGWTKHCFTSWGTRTSTYCLAQHQIWVDSTRRVTTVGYNLWGIPSAGNRWPNFWVHLSLPLQGKACCQVELGMFEAGPSIWAAFSQVAACHLLAE